MVSVFLEQYLKKGDVVVVTNPNTITLKYYLHRRGLSSEFTELNKSKAIDRAIVVVNRGLGQNLEYVLERRSFLDNVISMITVRGYRIEKTRQIDCHSVGRDRLGALIAVSYSTEPEQLHGPRDRIR